MFTNSTVLKYILISFWDLSSNILKQRGGNGKQNALSWGVANLPWSCATQLWSLMCYQGALHHSTESYIMQQYAPLLNKISAKLWENQKQPSKGTTMPKCDFNKVAKKLYWNHTSAWMFSCKVAAYFQKHLFLRTPLDDCFWKMQFSSTLNCNQKLKWYLSIELTLSFCLQDKGKGTMISLRVTTPP